MSDLSPTAIVEALLNSYGQIKRLGAAPESLSPDVIIRSLYDRRHNFATSLVLAQRIDSYIRDFEPKTAEPTPAPTRHPWLAQPRVPSVSQQWDRIFEGAQNIVLEHEAKAAPQFEKTAGQAKAWSNLLRWLKGDDPFYVLKGYAGTGKSFLMHELNQLTSHNFYFSAPTNKATKVLSDFIGESCKTTYSLLGLKMVEEDDKMVLSSTARTPDLGSNPILVIDEAGMIPKFMAQRFRELADTHGWRFIFVGDPAQLNPIGESRSVVWSFAEPENRSLLTEVKRFDNQLLQLSINIRSQLKGRDYESSPIHNDNDGTEGVFVLPRKRMMNKMGELKLEDWKSTKVGCWRNKTVKQYNDWIRKGLGFRAEYEPNDLIMLAAPITNENGTIVAYTDEEFQVRSIEEREITIVEGTIRVRILTLNDSPLTLSVPVDQGEVSELLARRAAEASREQDGGKRKILWRRFWELKRKFQQIRHAYALTAHRLQGTTVDHMFVDQADVLANQNQREAYRALYVLATRPRLSLTTY